MLTVWLLELGRLDAFACHLTGNNGTSLIRAAHLRRFDQPWEPMPAPAKNRIRSRQHTGLNNDGLQQNDVEVGGLIWPGWRWPPRRTRPEARRRRDRPSPAITHHGTPA